MVGKFKKKFKQTLVDNTDRPQNAQRNKTPLLIMIIVALIIIGLQYSTSVFSPDPEEDSWGKIIMPRAGSTTGKTIKIIGETQDIRTGLYIWLAVEKPDIGLCRPKKRVLRNTRFNTSISMADGPEQAYRLSLYVLNETIHNQWKDWLDKKSFKALPVPAKIRQLDQVTLLFKN